MKPFVFGPQALLNLRFERGVSSPHISDNDAILECRFESLRTVVVYHPRRPSSPHRGGEVLALCCWHQHTSSASGSCSRYLPCLQFYRLLYCRSFYSRLPPRAELANPTLVEEHGRRSDGQRRQSRDCRPCIVRLESRRRVINRQSCLFKADLWLRSDTTSVTPRPPAQSINRPGATPRERRATLPENP